jgi:hypothetical protein
MWVISGRMVPAGCPGCSIRLCLPEVVMSVVNYMIRFSTPFSGVRGFGVTLQNIFWTGPFQVGQAYRDGVLCGHFTYFQGPVEILTLTLNNNEVYLFQNGVGQCASAAGEQGPCELVRQSL